jgi:ubiquinone/menaquinone biosynthesis C-methylase UbiE
MRPATSPAPRATETLAPPRARAPRKPLHDGAVTYDSENYAMLNRPIETERHMKRIVRFLRPQPGERLLEIGCGRGWLTQRVQRLCPVTYGVDVNPRSIAHGVTARLSIMDAVDLNFEDAQFDKLYSFHAIEHIVEADVALAEMFRVLVPGGTALLVYPAEPIRGLYAMPGAWLGFGNPLLARKLHVHKFTPSRIRQLASAAGFHHVESALDFFITPQFMTVLQKPLGPA